MNALPALLATALATAVVAGPAPRPPRPVADIVSPTWSNSQTRDAAHEVDQIVARLHLRPGDTVADIGAGSGYDTLRLAPRVHEVFAEDVTPEYLSGLRQALIARRIHNVRLVVGEIDDPKLPRRSIDAAIMVHMYHEVGDPYGLLAHLADAFRPGGRLGIEELDRPTQFHGTPPKLLICELGAAGYRLKSISPLKGPIGYFAVFTPPATGRIPSGQAAARCGV